MEETLKYHFCDEVLLREMKNINLVVSLQYVVILFSIKNNINKFLKLPFTEKLHMRIPKLNNCKSGNGEIISL